MDQAICSANVDKSAKICEAGDTTLANFAFGEFFQDLVANLIASFGAGCALAKDQAMAFPVDFDNTNRDGITDKALVFGFGGFTGHG